MIMLAAVRDFAGFYLVLTLTATGLAKFRMRRVTTNSLRVEGVVPPSLTAPVVMAVIAIRHAVAVVVAPLGGCRHRCHRRADRHQRGDGRSEVLVHFPVSHVEGTARKRCARPACSGDDARRAATSGGW